MRRRTGVGGEWTNLTPRPVKVNPNEPSQNLLADYFYCLKMHQLLWMLSFKLIRLASISTPLRQIY